MSEINDLKSSMKEISKMYERQAKLLEFMEKNPNQIFVPKMISQKYKDKKEIEQKGKFPL